MSDRELPPHLTVIQGSGEATQPSLTREDVAKRLGVSVSTVRRYEGTRLHPVITAKGVRMFTRESVERLAAALVAEQNTPRAMQKAAARAAELPKGELAALVFERLEQRHSLAEIVIALRVPPDEVRELYHAWLVGLWWGELRRSEPALPIRHTEQDVVRRVSADQLARMLARLPDSQPTRISLARAIGEFAAPAPDDPAPDAFYEYRNLAELGGFTVPGPIELSHIASRVGPGDYRVSAYGFDPPGLRWEVYVRLRESDESDGTPPTKENEPGKRDGADGTRA